MLVKSGCYLKGRLIAHKKCKNRILYIPAIVIKDYERGLISLQPSVDIYDFIRSEEYFANPDCLTVIDKKQHELLKGGLIKKK